MTGSIIATFKMKQPGIFKEGLPVVTFSEDIGFDFNCDTTRAIHVPQAHTDGDSFIHFKKANVIHAGDFFFNGFYPFIDVTHGGSLKGMIAAVDNVLSLADDNTKIIAGHGSIGNKAQLADYRQMLKTAYERLRKLEAEGKTAQEAAFLVHTRQAFLDHPPCLCRCDFVRLEYPAIVIHRPDRLITVIDGFLANEIRAAKVAVQIGECAFFESQVMRAWAAWLCFLAITDIGCRLGLYDKMIEFHVGDARDIIKQFDGPFDIVLNDIDKEQYPDTVELVLPRLRSGGIFITDNVLWGGDIFDKDPDEATQGILKFNDMIFNSEKFFSSIIPIRDGLGIAVKI